MADANRAIREQRWDEADRLIRDLVIADPEDLSVALLRVQWLNAQDKNEEAAEELIGLAGTHSDRAHLLNAQAAELYFEAGRYGRSIEIMGEAVSLAPKDLSIRARLAEMLNARGFRYDANEHLRYLAGRSLLTIEELVALMNPTNTWVTFSEKPNIDDAQQVEHDGALNVVAGLRARGDVRDARQLLEKCDAFRAKHPAAIAMHGRLLALTQDLVGLKSWAAAAAPECQRYPEYWLGLGSLLAETGDDRASSCFLQALQREPHLSEAVDGLMQVFKSQARDDEFQRARQRRIDLAEAKSLARKIMMDGPNPVLAIEMGRILNQLGLPIEAIAWQRTVIQQVSPTAQQLEVLRDHGQQVLGRLPRGRVDSVVRIGFNLEPETEILRAIDLQQTDRLRPAEAEQTLPSPSLPSFADVALLVGLRHRFKNAPSPIRKEFRLFEALGSGVACLDYDLDGLVDFYFGQAGSDPPDTPSAESNQLFRSLGTEFSNTTERTGIASFDYTLGVTAGDWNQDGFEDLVVGNWGANEWWINQGDGTFRRIQTTDAPAQFTASIAIADVTGDGLPDVVETNYVDDPRVFDAIEYDSDGKPIRLPGPKHFKAARDRVFISVGDGAANPVFFGIDGSASTGLGILVTDLDQDGKNEVFIANDQNPNQLWRLQDGKWQDHAAAIGCAFGGGGKPFACMGIAAADFDKNGRLDLHITNFADEYSNLYLQGESGDFGDRAIAYQLDGPTVRNVGFGTQIIDYDNNSTADLIIGNGHIEDFRADGKPFEMRTQILMRSQEGFIEAGVTGDDDFWSGTRLSRGVAITDWNRDGRVDAVVTDLQDNVSLLENRTDTVGQWLQVELVGTATERDAIGTTVRISAAGFQAMRVVQSGDGYLCNNEPVLFFGLGDQESVSIEVDWPSGASQRFENVTASERVLLIEGEHSVWDRSRG